MHLSFEREEAIRLAPALVQKLVSGDFSRQAQRAGSERRRRMARRTRQGRGRLYFPSQEQEEEEEVTIQE